MSTVRASARGAVAAPADIVYGYLADYERHRPKFLPPEISGLAVDEGGVGAGTVFRCTVSAGGRSRDYRMRVAEPEPGRVLSESDLGSSLVTTFTVSPQGSGCAVRIETTWNGAGGIGGFFERMFAPGAMRRIYADELTRLDAYARGMATQP